MVHDHAEAVERLRQQVAKGKRDVAEADRDALLRFSDALHLRKSRCGDARHEKLLRHCAIMAESVGGLADALDDRDAAEAIVRWIHTTYSNEETNRDYRVALRVFGRHATDASVSDDPNDPPRALDWIPSGTSRNYDPSPDPSKMLRWEEDVLEMIDAATNPRDAALAAVLFDLGPRSGEAKGLRVDSVADSKYGLKVTLNGKTGRRSPTLVPSVPHLRKWLAVHPGRDEVDAPLWSKLDAPEAISDRAFQDILDRLAKRAGVTRPVTPTNFRKSSASYLASRGMSQAHIEDHHGWVRGSRVAARYVSIFAEDADRELARIHGLDVEADIPDSIAPKTCPRCERETPRDEPLCVWCGQALSPSAAAEVSDVHAELFDEAAAASDERTVEFLRGLRELLDEDPSKLARLLNEA